MKQQERKNTAKESWVKVGEEAEEWYTYLYILFNIKRKTAARFMVLGNG